MGVLFLFIKVADRDLRLELREGTKLSIGRSKDCDIVLEPKKISGHHLEILWDGRKVTIEDSNSTFGTTLLPEKSAFTKKTFSPAPTQLSLLLADTAIYFAWNLKGFDEEQTALVNFDKEQGVEKTVLSENLAATPKPNKKSKQTNIKKEIQVLDSDKTEKEVQARADVKTFHTAAAAFLISLLPLFGIYHLWWGSKLKNILESENVLLSNGGGLDLFIEASKMLKEQWLVFFVFVGLSLWILFWNPFFAIEEKFGQWKKIFSTTRVRFVGVFLLLLTLLSPFLFSFRYGVSPTKAKPTLEFLLLKNKNLGAESMTHKLLDLALPLQGSTHLYLELLNVRFSRIYEQCTKEENQDWDRQRLCLVLFMAASLETFNDIRPALIAEISMRLTLLLALDGVIRVTRVEGLESQSVAMFLNSLESMNMAREKQKINEIIFKNGATKENVLGELVIMRRKLDQRLGNRQLELGLPDSLQLKPFNPLSAGL